jgi:hypothetical protein
LADEATGFGFDGLRDLCGRRILRSVRQEGASCGASTTSTAGTNNTGAATSSAAAATSAPAGGKAADGG